MREQIILSCPFCHNKAEYRDAPPGSTVRCEECECIFRVPALHRRTPGGVLKGEAIRGSRKKLLVVLLVVLLVAAGGVFAWQRFRQQEETVKDPFSGLPYPEDSSLGTLMRFLQSWKMGDLPLMLNYCRPGDQQVNPDREQAKKFEEWLQATFGNVRLTGSHVTLVKPVSESLNEFPNVELTGEDTRTKAPLKGSMSPKVHLEQGPDGKAKWGVDVRSAVPRWD